MNSKLDRQNYKLLLRSILKIRTIEEADMFIKDLIPASEIKTTAMRLYIAQQLIAKVPYLKIQKNTGASSATVAKVSEGLRKGAEGLKLILMRIGK